MGTGDRVFGVPDYAGQPGTGLANYVILSIWQPMPAGLDFVETATLPMVVEMAALGLDLLGPFASPTLLVNGGGTVMGFTAVQIALTGGARVSATAGETFTGRLSKLGADVTLHGEGMVERVRTLVGGASDLVLHAALAPGMLPELVRIVDGNPLRVMSIGDLDKGGLGVRTSKPGAGSGAAPRRARSLREACRGEPFQRARGPHLHHGE